MSAKTLAVIYKEKIVEMPDAIDDVKEVANYHKEALKYAVEEMKGKAKGKSKKTVDAKKDENGKDKVNKPPTEYQMFVKDYHKIIKEKFPDLPSNQRLTKIADEWKKHKKEKAGVPQVTASAQAVVNNYMKVEEVSPPSSDNEEEPKAHPKAPPKAPPKEPPKAQPKTPNEEPDEVAVEEPQVPLKKGKKNLPPIKIPVNRM